ncbi:hypothetical protein DICPUDRAFT_78187 [Dictyostelium purpureum]|uniref:leucine--tRNA ligase n=1 Tax=Dictyostelium purpureum TaxID=5786 RepID=F0ZIT8_DICPU|nr:uncharacterized protein DICPUDRAFT_78187 [Dictyostelium purpureum]EGC36146.1 hypothetical protein DICPUDRAFT_78187 [Dictyostelium purpureum]|eukprot:XP_003287339.1 hypothetical protein DICPUDRAFT_78187 [Dictyostelium purpureum]
MSNIKLNYIRDYEKDYQNIWLKEKSFEIDAVEEEEDSKYYVSTPLPFIDGNILLSQALIVCKADFMAKYQQLKGKRVLFPFGFHSSNKAFKRWADSLKSEIEQYGNPPNFPNEDNKAKGRYVIKKFYQWNYMKSFNIPEEEISKFVDPQYCFSYFSRNYERDLKSLGIGIDWRRSFYTSRVNKYYSSFIGWQFETLKQLGKIKYGKRYSIWSPMDNQYCSNQDRLEGEAEVVTTLTLIKLLVQELTSILKEKLNGYKKVYLVSGTLRPELCYGVTNCWVLPDELYGAYEMANGDVFICNQSSIRNMSFQDLTKNRGEYPCISQFNGSDLIGTVVVPPLSIHKGVYVLPMVSMNQNKGTGISISVPSDSPKDCVALQDLLTKEAYRSKYKVQYEWIQFEIIPIIDIPGFSNLCAINLTNRYEIKSQNDKIKIERANEECYIKGYNDGVMMVGKYKGHKVSQAKEMIRDELISSGDAIEYAETCSKVVSRSGEECVVALISQWYIAYGDDDIVWMNKVDQQIEEMELYNVETKNRLKYALQFIRQWSCSHRFGLGSIMPWNEKLTIDSLSDSTLYTVFSTIAHLLQGDFEGSKPGIADITPEKMTHQVWDYVLLNKDYPEDCSISKETLSLLKKEFQYWYPVDFVVSSSALVHNHILFFLYTHIAIFSNSKNNLQPKCIRAVADIRNEKMTMQEFNRYQTVSDSIKAYSADGCRMVLVDAGDGFDPTSINNQLGYSSILKFYAYIEWVQEIIDTINQLNSGPPTAFQDIVFDSEINKIIIESDKAYEKSNFRDVVHLVFYQLLNARDHYKISAQYSNQAINKQLILKFIEIQAILFYPIAPHFSQKIFHLLNKGDILNARWPTPGPVHYIELKKDLYLKRNIHNFRKSLTQFRKDKKNNSLIPSISTIYYTRKYPVWQEEAINYLTSIYENQSLNADNTVIVNELKSRSDLKPHIKDIMGYIEKMRQDMKEIGKEAFVNLDEYQILTENAYYISNALGIGLIDIQEYTNDIKSSGNKIPQLGYPTISFI